MDGFTYDLQVKNQVLSTFTYSLLIHGGLGFIVTKHEVLQCDLGHEFLGPKYKFHLPS